MKLLYLSCHEVLEYDEVTLFAEIGVEAFPASRYLTTKPPKSLLRPPLPETPSTQEDARAFRSLAVPGHDTRECLTREFVDRFDAVLVMHHPGWISQNWDAMRHKPVIWRTIGQSLPELELMIHPLRDDGLRIVRYSPAERDLPMYAGDDVTIRFYKDSNEWQGWVGDRLVVLCFSQFIAQRVIECNFDVMLQVINDLPCDLYGPNNREAGKLWRGCLTHPELRSALMAHRAYFHTGTFPASYTLGFMEAWMTGIPVVAIGPGLFGRANPSLQGIYEIPHLIEHEVNGFVSDDVDELRSCLQCLLARPEYANEVSQAGRRDAMKHFDKPKIREQWFTYFNALGIPNSGLKSPGSTDL